MKKCDFQILRKPAYMTYKDDNAIIGSGVKCFQIKNTKQMQ